MRIKRWHACNHNYKTDATSTADTGSANGARNHNRKKVAIQALPVPVMLMYIQL